MIIEIEGIDGVGKTTQCILLKKAIEATGRQVTIVKDLDSTELGISIKKVLVSRNDIPPKVELFSFLACKTQLFSQVILPLVKSDTVVICDRGIGSFVSYFEVFGFERKFLENSIDMAINTFVPEITILIDISIEEASKRNARKSMRSKFDDMGDEFFQAQRRVFLELAKSSRWNVVDGKSSIQDIHSAIIDIVK